MDDRKQKYAVWQESAGPELEMLSPVSSGISNQEIKDDKGSE